MGVPKLAALLAAGLLATGAVPASASTTPLHFKTSVKLRLDVLHVKHGGRVHVFVYRYFHYRHGVAQRTIEVPVLTVVLHSGGGVHTVRVPVTPAVRQASLHGLRRSDARGQADLYFIGDFGKRSCVTSTKVSVLRRAHPDATAAIVTFRACRKP